MTLFRLSLATLASGVAAATLVAQTPALKSVQPTDHLLASSPGTFKTSSSFESRDVTLKRLKEKAGKQYDMLVIGGGATGCSVALDAVCRGLTVVLLEKNDYSSGTSSKSTKLLHGGVRYLEKAVLDFDREQFRMVKEALAERANLIRCCPYLAYPIPIMLPVYSLWQLPYFWIGIKLYDLFAGRERLKKSYVIGKQQALELFPMLRTDRLRGAIVYFDGQHNDSRMNVTLAMTASARGADVVNHAEIKDFVYDENGQICGAKCEDKITGEKFDVHSRSVVNATGPLVDLLRRKDNPECEMICQPSAGVHIVLPDYYCPSNIGLLDPSTKDGRVVFLLPWENHTIAGTTDSPCEPTDHPQPTDEEVEYILHELRNYTSSSLEVRRGDVLSVWAGVRPLVKDLSKGAKTEALARNHVIEVSRTGLITIAGGKWTTCRQMAEDVVDMAIDRCKLANDTTRPCGTKALKLLGAHQWNSTHYIRLVQDYGLDSNTAKHLSRTYGDQAEEVAKLCRPSGKRWPLIGRQLHSLLPYVDGEVRYAIKQHACSVVDIIANRTRMAFLNVLATREALPGIAKIMAEELKWSKKKQKEELDSAIGYLRNNMEWQPQSRLSSDRHGEYGKIFDEMDSGNRGFITFDKFNKYIKTHKAVYEDELLALLNELEDGKQGTIEKEDFCKVLAIIESGKIGYDQYRKASRIFLSNSSLERSGGSV